jgi:hypothetical protein
MDFNFCKYKDNRLVIGSSKVHDPHAKWLWFNLLELNVAYVEFHEISNNILEQFFIIKCLYHHNIHGQLLELCLCQARNLITTIHVTPCELEINKDFIPCAKFCKCQLLTS